MGKKGGSGKTYTSKGKYPTVNRKFKNLMRRERRANPTLDMVLAKMEYRNELGRRKDAASQEAYRRILEKESQEIRAYELWKKYESVGATYAGAMQAVKTDFIPSFEEKWQKRRG